MRKYYIKNEDEKHGLRTAYLVETDSHTLQWKTMTAEEAFEDDAAAWYLSFTPSNQYYQLKNAASGYYMTYASGFKTISRSKPTTADNIHLMRGRVNVDGHRGFYFIHPESSANPPVLNATANGKTGTAQWNISKKATAQRWLILTADEAMNFDNGNIDQARAELAEMIARIIKLAETPHTEDVEGADATLVATLTDIESQVVTCTKGKEVNALSEQARAAAVTFLSSVSATDVEQPFDLTFLIENPDFDNDGISGWTSTNGNPGYGAHASEFYERTFDFYQVLDDMPAGNYSLRANIFQRPGSNDVIYSPYNKGTAKITTSLYINKTSAAVKHILDDRQSKALFSDGGGHDVQMPDGTYIPNCKDGAVKYFAKGLYDSSVSGRLDEAGSSLRVGVKCTNASSYYWTMFDHFRLHFFGGAKTTDDIQEVVNEELKLNHDEVYDLQGRKIIDRRNVHRQLTKGLYIVGGKKVIITQ